MPIHRQDMDRDTELRRLMPNLESQQPRAHSQVSPRPMKPEVKKRPK
jgi:hypothetical protein